MLWNLFCRFHYVNTFASALYFYVLSPSSQLLQLLKKTKKQEVYGNEVQLSVWSLMKSAKCLWKLVRHSITAGHGSTLAFTHVPRCNGAARQGVRAAPTLAVALPPPTRGKQEKDTVTAALFGNRKQRQKSRFSGGLKKLNHLRERRTPALIGTLETRHFLMLYKLSFLRFSVGGTT